MVFYETPKGGAVFSVSSIAWAGALAHACYDNNVSRVTSNVIRRFLDPTPLGPEGQDTNPIPPGLA
jgi:N,N-dimethylformamidase